MGEKLSLKTLIIMLLLNVFPVLQFIKYHSFNSFPGYGTVNSKSLGNIKTEYCNINKIHSIELKSQLKKINYINKRIFSRNHKFTPKRVNKTNILILTVYTINQVHKQSKQAYQQIKKGISEYFFHHQTKFNYASIHNYDYIIDTSNYIEMLNVKRYENITYDLNEIHKITNDTKLINMFQNMFQNDYPYSYSVNRRTKEYKHSSHAFNNRYEQVKFENNTKLFFSNIYITNHWNKVLSLIYWSKYYDFILLLDDDSFISNSNSNYKIENILNKISTIHSNYNVFFMHSHISPETYAILFNTTNKQYSYKYFYDWFENRKFSLPYYDQTALWKLNQKHIFNDPVFISQLQKRYPKQYTQYILKNKICQMFASHQCVLQVNNIIKPIIRSNRRNIVFGNVSVLLADSGLMNITLCDNLHHGSPPHIPNINDYFNQHFILHLKYTYTRALSVSSLSSLSNLYYFNSNKQTNQNLFLSDDLTQLCFDFMYHLSLNKQYSFLFTNITCNTHTNILGKHKSFADYVCNNTIGNHQLERRRRNEILLPVLFNRPNVMKRNIQFSYCYIGKNIEIPNNTFPISFENKTQLIEKNIFQTMTKIDTISNRAKLLKQLNPEYKYYLYTDDDIDDFMNNEMIEYFNGNVTKAYNLLNKNIGSARADIWRYSVLYVKGGIYVDYDCAVYEPFRNIINTNDTAIISNEGAGHKKLTLQQMINLYKLDDVSKLNDYRSNEIIQYAMIFQSKHVILESVLSKISNEILSKHFQETYLNQPIKDKHFMHRLVYDTTGPVAFTDGVNGVINNKDVDYQLHFIEFNGNIIHYWEHKEFYRGLINYTHYTSQINQSFLVWR